MKNILLISNIILAIAVAILFYLHFAKPSQKANHPIQALATGNGSVSTIVYVNTDSLQAHLTFFNETKAKLETENNQLEATSRANAQRLQSDYEKLQKGASNMTADQIQAAEENLKTMQQTYMDTHQQMEDNLADKAQTFNKDLMQKIHDYLVTYNKKKNYQYILAYAYPGALLLADPSFDITNEIIEGMNAEHKKLK
jgi:outer membrane protein